MKRNYSIGAIIFSRFDSSRLFGKALKDINSKREILEKQIDEEIKKAEEEISELKRTGPEKINKIAIETSSEILKSLIGTDVNNSSISAIVHDLSKKNGNNWRIIYKK